MAPTTTRRPAHALTPRRTVAVAATALAVVAGCTSGSADGERAGSSGPTTTAQAVSAKAPVRPVFAKNINVPWGMAFLPGGGTLVTSRDTGKVLLVHAGGHKRVVRQVVGVVPTGSLGGEGGLLGIALSPRFAADHWVYVYMTTAHDNRIIRMRWSHHRLGAQHLILKGIPTSLHHNGGRIAFGPDGMLYATTGEAEVPSRAQNRHSLGGKILRMTPLGKPAPGNPWRHSVVYSIGHRNVEGLTWDPQGRLWATEFGDHTWDELNLIKPGHNYGWPVVEGRSRDRRFTNPKAVWHTDQCGPSGIAITRVHGQTVAYIGSVTGQRLWRVELDGHKVVGKHAWYIHRFGRIRSTYVHGGRLYFTSSNTDGRATPRRGDDKIFWVTPR